MPDAAGRKHHVVIVGGGFAGVGCARRLARSEDVRVTLIDRNNYHQFQPLLYQVATSQLAASHIAFSLRKLFRKHPNVSVKLGEVASVDPATHTVATTDGTEHTGDAVVIAAGSRAELLRHARRRRALVPALRARRTPSACGRASSPSSRRPTATRR